MSIATFDFNNRSDIGYNKSGNALYLSNIMDSSKRNFSMNDPLFTGGNNKSQNNKTVFQQLDKGNNVNRSVGHINSNLKVDPNKTITNGESVSQSLSAGKEQIKTAKASMEKTWDNAKGQAVQCLKEAASNQGICKNAAVKSIVPQESSDKLAASATIATDIATGGAGSMVASVLGGGYVAVNIGKEARNLNKDQIESLIKEATKIAQSGGAQDTRARASATPSADIKRSNYADISKLDNKGMEKLLTQNLEDQPEYKAACDIENELKEVEENHKYAASNYNPQDVVIDSADVKLCGDCTQGIKLTASHEVFYSDAVRTISNYNKSSLDNDMKIPDISNSLRVST